MRLTFIQYAGDYREAYARLTAGGKETYQAQRYSVDFVGSLSRSAEISVICAMSDGEYDEIQGNGVRAIGLAMSSRLEARDLLDAVARTRPDRLILTTPILPIVRWANARDIRLLAVLADSFEQRTWRAMLRYRRLAKSLNGRAVEFVANHGINASVSLSRIGVKPSKIVPWDWPPSHRPADFTPRRRRRDCAFRLIYVGSVSPAKGVEDLLHAVAALKAQKLSVLLTVIGEDCGSKMQAKAVKLGIADVVQFLGRRANDEIPSAMREADCVVIPSRHEYPEGLPLTIYEALSTHTPIIASDHPMFIGALNHRTSALIFPASNVQMLASAIRELSQDDSLYEHLSANSAEAWQGLQLPVRWADLIEAWISDDPDQRKWILNHSLASQSYADRITTNSLRRYTV
ncbi:glycosyltransferase family 4 protein [Sphingomonas mesophila]|uniref:glycosyltransferase family 4 protein n=1 Tax=Sphingomonas mesophila TaxID=2303576 RepID=UPI000E571B37|nr:glycosyltransferase family 4 protein [Sphingomonas mesophila]